MSSGIPPVQYDHFFTLDEIESYARKLAEARPRLCRLGTLGRSREGRPIPLLTITDCGTSDPDSLPGYLIHANIHATEVSGTHAALETAYRLLADHPQSDLLKRVVFYIVPRINPDGAEWALRSNAAVRSRSDRSERRPNTLYQEDVDGDGTILEMRFPAPDGDFVADPRDPRLMIRRRAGLPGPFYRVMPEGLIHEWDGSDALRIGSRSFDWNRSWSYEWRPEPEQGGSGDFPFSEPEMRTLAEFLHGHKNLFAVLGYHTGPSAVLRPPSTGSVEGLDLADDQRMEDIARMGARQTGFPVVPVVKYHDARHRDVNRYGHFHGFGYQHLGLFVFEFELGVLMNSAGIPTTEIHGCRTEEEKEELERRTLAWCDRNGGLPPVHIPWRPFEHPQLGRGEIGGFVRIRRYNPTLHDLQRIAEGTYRFTIEHAQLHPRLLFEHLAVDEVARGVSRIRLRVANRGALPTHVSNRGRQLGRHAPVRVEFHPAPGVKLLSAYGHREVGHLAEMQASPLLEWFVARPTGGDGQICSVRLEGGAGGSLGLELPDRSPRGAAFPSHAC